MDGVRDRCGHAVPTLGQARGQSVRPGPILALLYWATQKRHQGAGHLAKREHQELSQDALARINSVVRSLQEDRVERGVDLSRPMRCDSCGQEKPAAGSAQYGAYKLCNDCLLDFTVSLASGHVSSVADYMTRNSEGPEAVPPTDLSEHRERSSQVNTRLSRDKLMPSNEPC